MNQLRKRLTYANVMSSIAVFLILGGATAVAAKKIGSNQLKAKSVGTAKLKRGAVATTKLKRSAVTTAKLANDAVTGDKVRNGTLTTADLVPGALTPTCPSGTALSQGVCFEVAARPATSYNEANLACVAAGRRLPSAAELSGFTQRVQVIPSQERSGDLADATTSFNVDSNGTFSEVAFATAAAFRCVATPTP